MSSKKKNPAPARAVAKLDTPLQPKNGEELVTVTRQQVDAIKLATGYSATPAVQTAVTTLSTSTDNLETTLSAINTKRAELVILLGTREQNFAAVTRDRASLRTAITANAHGSSDAIKAWNCLVQTQTVPAPTTDAPQHLVLKNDLATAGTILAKCKGVKGAASYVFVFSTDPNAAPGVGTLVLATKARCTITSQPLGHVVSVRVAVVRKGGGQSVWSEAVPILVR